MGLIPKTQFVQRAGASLAYQVFGAGPRNLLVLSGHASHLEQLWQFPAAVRTNEHLALLTRIAMYDGRGWGMSDSLPIDGYAVEDLAADALAVADAAGFERSVLFATSIGGAVAIWLAVHHPERVDGLVLSGATACFTSQPGYDVGFDEAAVAERRAFLESVWGTGTSITLLVPSAADDARLIEEWARYERLGATPTALVAGFELAMGVDVRDLLPRVSVPTLVLHTAADRYIPPTQGRYLAEHIPDARYVEIIEETMTSGVNGDVAEFLTGSRAAAHLERSLQVVLFADIVASTDRAADMGDQAWRNLLDDFRHAVRAVLARYEAREVSTRGDDFFVVVASPSLGIEVARAIRSETATLGLEIRCGLHLGEVERQGDDCAGLAVHIGARIEGLAEAGEILVSQTVRDALVGSGLRFTSRGEHHLKGVPGQWQVFAIES